MNRVRHIIALLVPVLLTIIGFGSCRSSRKASKSVQDLQPVPPQEFPKNDPRNIRLLYGAPPVKYQQKVEIPTPDTSK